MTALDNNKIAALLQSIVVTATEAQHQLKLGLDLDRLDSLLGDISSDTETVLVELDHARD